MKRRGFILNSAVLVLLIPMLLLLATYEDVSSQIFQAQSERVLVERSFRGIAYFDSDFQKALEISGKRALIAAIDYVTVTGEFIKQKMANETLKDLILFGTSEELSGYENLETIMQNQTIARWLALTRDYLLEQGFLIEQSDEEILNNINLTVGVLDSFTIFVKARIPNITVRDFNGKIVYSGSIPKSGNYTYAFIDIRNLEDPLFPPMTGGRYSRSIRACLYPYPELIGKPIKVLEGNGSSDKQYLLGNFSRNVNKTYIYFGDFYPGDGALAYVLLNGSLEETDRPIIVNTSIGGISISPVNVFNESDAGVLVFKNLSAGSEKGGWCALSYNYRVNITINNPSSTTLTNFQVPITLELSSNKISLPQTPNIMVYDEDCNPINFWVEEWQFSSQGAWDNVDALIWVNVTLPAKGEKTISIYFDSNAVENWGNASKVFDFYDDFESWEGWQDYGNGVVEQSSEQAYEGDYSLKKDQNNDPNGGEKLIGKTIGRGYILEGYIYRPSNWGGGNQDRLGLEEKEGSEYKGYTMGVVHNINNPNNEQIKIDRRDPSDPSVQRIGYTYIRVPEDEWYFFRMILDDLQLTFQIYTQGSAGWALRYFTTSTPYAQVLASDSTYNSFDRVVIHGGYEYYVDSLRIRKYADQMPSASVSDTIETKPAESVGIKPSSAKAYDLQPFLSCLLEQMYFGVYNGWSIFERLEGSYKNHENYEELANKTQDELGISYENKHYPIGLVSFLIPHDSFDSKLSTLFTSGLTARPLKEGQSSADYYFLQYYFGNGNETNGYRMWGVSYGTFDTPYFIFSPPGDLSFIPFFLDNQTALSILGKEAACDLLVNYPCS
ncbi:hypothetical protein OCC_01574 [Thermococcus litoralis DSM 5473]|uniref:DUF2341 domain-containing protein n=1 Tax=Thermococcus litoralis (strain ATCC 51850 / DSM 5473 / JCM 8560 / NS-C) TaxID=523849 RepID=H3ZLP0_THELN|nr:DUF2341 domain-containing protein [Thermococcus litoralis]EHR79178.1 hypothetical protein OCC_01574 [Thermococcus litoralis DSM 5473]